MERVKEERGQTRHSGDVIRRPNTVASTDQRGYRIVEAAEYMGVTPWFVEVKIRSGELPALKLCRHYTILKQDMDAFLDRHRAALLDKNRWTLTQSAECRRSSESVSGQDSELDGERRSDCFDLV
jgi:excisionase family DNA binding protein